MNFYPRRRRMPQVIIVSMIDIFAILLIFVIVTMTFKVPVPEPPPKQPSVSIKLPESTSATSGEQAGNLTIIAVTKTPQGEKVYLDDQEVSLLLLTHELKARLAVKKEEKPAFAMRADESISYGFLIKVLDALKDGGVQGNLSAFTETKK